jgi:nucleoid-associated protein EbfC
MLKGLGNIASLMRNAQEIQARAAEMRERLAALRVEGAAGGGMVRVEATGEQKLVGVSIEESLVNSGDRELLEDLLVAAVNQALEQSRAAAAEEMSNLTDGLNLPGLEEALAKFGLGGK